MRQVVLLILKNLNENSNNKISRSEYLYYSMKRQYCDKIEK